MSAALGARLAGLSLLVVGCAGDPLNVVPPPPPTFDDASVEANPTNVLSAVVRVSVRDADSVAVRLHAAGELTSDITTPAVAVGDGDGVLTIPVLGLFAERRYTFRPVAFGRGGSVVGAALELTTDTLPSDLPHYVASGADPDSGYVVFGADRYGLVIDNTGRVVWYHRFPTGPGLSFSAQSTGKYYARLPKPLANEPSEWVEIDPLGRVTRTLGCLDGLTPRFHDIIVQHDQSYWLLCDETRTMDLSTIGGVAGARVTGTAIQHVSADNRLLFRWSPFDHFAITDGNPRDLAGAAVNWTHGNAIEIAPDGSLLASFRNLGEITKIDTVTGRVVWRLGGRRNEFTILETAGAGFAGQHSIRTALNGEILLLDNVGATVESRAERYALDEKAKTARLLRSYASTPGVVTEVGGSVQRLPLGHTLVSFGTAGRVEEYDADGRVVWHIERGAGYVFRAQRIPLLYAPGVGATR